MRLILPKNRIEHPIRSAFTLVEMLVAVALVTILMSMFAQIFSLAAEIMGRQRGLALNDQAERNIQTIIRGDLDSRTFRTLIPFRSGITPTTEEKARQGYFHIEEGEPENNSDDILQFTVERSEDVEPFYGKAWELNLLAYGGANYPIGTPPGPFGYNPNQPEFDDEILSPNSVGASRYAEISYFLRYGTLYRRCMLIREPKVGTDPNPQSGNLGTGGLILAAAYPAVAPRNFWSDFDYATFFNGTSPQFLGNGHLLNDIGVSPSFGLPQYRFGFDFITSVPRTRISNGTITSHIGRFTHRETSDLRFQYPGQAASTYGTNPFSSGAVLNLDPATGQVTEFNTGTRSVDDVLMTNVHSFDIKVWEPGFVLGPDNVPGNAGNDDGNTTADQPNSGTGSSDSLLGDVNELGALGSDDWWGPDNAPGAMGIDDDGQNGVDDIGEVGWPETDDADPNLFLDFGHGRPLPQFLFGGTVLGSSNNSSFGNCYDTWHPDASIGAGADTTIPFNPVIQDTSMTPNIWRIPLKMIRIHIRYIEPKSEQMRDVVIIHSLVN